MRKSILAIFICTLLGSTLQSADAAADTQCYKIAEEGKAFSRTPELLCIRSYSPINVYEITLESGLAFNRQIIAAFQLNLLSQGSCTDCNEDVYGVANPMNSTFNALQVAFDGKLESGIVSIGQNRFSYQAQ
tara:strand:+ start:936 stop:1331 length:396 start_codon:yes stop_codon:yes gene_type:complete